MLKPLSSSKTVKPSYSPSKVKGSHALDFTIAGRAPSVLTYGTNSPQGDHVTAHRLVEEGLFRRLSVLTVDEVETLFDIENRTHLRKRRSALYDYISAIAILDPVRKESLYLALDSALLTYNSQRHKKTNIKDSVKELHESEVVGTPYLEALRGQEARFRENGEKMRNLFRDVSALLMTFYNKIPHTAYHYIEGFKEEAGDIKVAKTKVGEVLEWLERNGADGHVISSAALAAKRPEVASVMNSLIHYPEITDEAKLAAHVAENIDKKGRSNKPRNNSKATLIEILARHVHIFFAVYPELKINFDEHGDLTDDFVDKFLGVGAAKPNWPSIASNADQLKSVKDGVKAQIVVLENSLTDNHYGHWKAARIAAGEDLDSSDDENIETKPRTKPAPVAAKALVHIEVEEFEDMQKELERLRLMKKIILKNRGLIPKEVMDEMDVVFDVDKTKPVKSSKGRHG